MAHNSQQDEAWRTRLRQGMQRQRADLNRNHLDEVGRAVAQHLKPELVRLRALAGYLAVRGEPSVEPALRLARTNGAMTAVPIVRGQSMTFVPVDDSTVLVRNRFGIPEPEIAVDPDRDHENGRPPLHPAEFDLVLVPLVAFDSRGNRLGMGGGFYDRTFADAAARPRLIGIAHDFQRVDALQAMSWDVPLDAIVTASGLYPITTTQAKNSR